MKKSKTFELLKEGQWLQPIGSAFYIMNNSDKNMTYETVLERLRTILSDASLSKSFYIAISIIS